MMKWFYKTLDSTFLVKNESITCHKYDYLNEIYASKNYIKQLKCEKFQKKKVLAGWFTEIIPFKQKMHGASLLMNTVL